MTYFNGMSCQVFVSIALVELVSVAGQPQTKTGLSDR